MRSLWRLCCHPGPCFRVGRAGWPSEAAQNVTVTLPKTRFCGPYMPACILIKFRLCTRYLLVLKCRFIKLCLISYSIFIPYFFYQYQKQSNFAKIFVFRVLYLAITFQLRYWQNTGFKGRYLDFYATFVRNKSLTTTILHPSKFFLITHIFYVYTTRCTRIW